MDRLERESLAGTAARWRAAGAAAAAVIALTAGAAWVLRALPSEGHLAAADRTSVEVGGRAVVVAEAGAELAWRSAWGKSRVVQRAGDAFYRVDRGGPFSIDTPAGTIEVTGTCFRVEVSDMKSSKAGLIGATAGAAFGALVVVTVYEGNVVTASPGGTLPLAAGESARLEPERAPARLSAPPPKPASGLANAPASSALAPPAVPSALPSGPTALDGLNAAALKVEAERLRARVSELEAAVGKAEDRAREGKTYDLTQEELLALARKCELRWDMPGLGTDPGQIGPKDASKLGISEAEREQINQVFAAYHARIDREIRKAYTEATGDEDTGSLSLDAMVDEITDKAGKDLVRLTFQKLSRERAGLDPRAPENTPMLPVEKLYRTLTGAGDRLQQMISDEVGPSLAGAIRDQDGGFGSKSRSSWGCPGQ